ncbi:putative gpi anchored protein [Neofusicoccum parvum UCRNP2]|uniref:Putative gpi anchored protein n=1 Tax=Botryosphaeria parva (strain UCR-NP2) TaxID=1287680 RepID=R1EST9_BOTPV|nr:putative gpi anchored protein [Neofusicoccum parvum UCRNP2]
MLSPTALLLSASLTTLASAHFVLDWPVKRGFDDDKSGTFPCGGFDTPSSNRTAFPLSGAPIQLDMHHTETNVMVVLGVGNDPGTAFNIILRPTFRERGPENFCMGDIEIPASANLTEGMNATIQVVSNGDPDGGLYQCADITITNTPLTTDEVSQHCTNSSGVTTQAISNPGNANETSESSSSASGTASSSSASATASTGAATLNSWSGVWALGAAALGGAAALL